MKNLAKLIVISVFALGAFVMFLSNIDASRIGSVVLAKMAVTPTPAPKLTPTPPASNTSTNTNTAVNANTAVPVTPATDDKSIPKTFTVGKDSLSQNELTNGSEAV